MRGCRWMGASAAFGPESWNYPNASMKPLLGQQYRSITVPSPRSSILKHSALALDIYTWLSHRLCRITSTAGTKLSWANLKEQFGQEYGNSRDFKKEFRHALRQAAAVYPEARLEEDAGGMLLLPSKPPLPKSRITIQTP